LILQDLTICGWLGIGISSSEFYVETFSAGGHVLRGWI
jgi:hypothetical protein